MTSDGRTPRQFGSAVQIRTFDTASLAVGQQVAQWEAHTRSHILGVRCFSANCGPLHASQRNGLTGTVGLSEMRVTAHVVERRAEDILEEPRDLVLVFLLLEGEAMFGQGGRWVTAQAGDIVAMASDIPFIGTFPRAVRQMVLSLPQSEFATLCGRQIEGLEYFSRADLGHGTLHWLTCTGLNWLERKPGGPPRDVRAMGLGLIAEIFVKDPIRREERPPANYLAAQAWIADNIADPELGVAAIAAALKISPRHLSRLFAHQGTTVRRCIDERRLQLARHMLLDPSRARLSIGEIAYLCGFSEQSLFSRQFRREFGHPPSTLRRPAPHMG